MTEMSTLRVGIMGLGTVGGGVVKILKSKHDSFAKLGIDLEVAKVFSRRDHRLAELGLTQDQYCSDFESFISSPLDLVVEVIGGDVAAEYIERALEKGLSVVTANKALLATQSKRFIGSKYSDKLFFEASCCGGIPIISAFEEGLTGNHIEKLMGIFNGTCNFILSKMEKEELEFNKVLALAQELGYAEADPTFDIEGIDATHKLCLLAGLSFQQVVQFEKIASEGISNLSPREFSWADDHGFSIRLVSMADETANGELYMGTFPMLLPWAHPLSNIRSANNAVFLKGDAVGELLFSGPGAGEMPTASAVVSDIIAAAQDRKRLWSSHVFRNSEEAQLSQDKKFPFYIRLKTEDKAGVLSALCAEFAAQEVSLKEVLQRALPQGNAELIFTTHPQFVEAIDSAIAKMKQKALVMDQPLRIRILEI